MVAGVYPSLAHSRPSPHLSHGVLQPCPAQITTPILVLVYTIGNHNPTRPSLYPQPGLFPATDLVRASGAVTQLNIVLPLPWPLPSDAAAWPGLACFQSENLNVIYNYKINL